MEKRPDDYPGYPTSSFDKRVNRRGVRWYWLVLYVLVMAKLAYVLVNYYEGY